MKKSILTALLVVASASVASAQNVIVNGGFETGDFTGWSSTGTNYNGGGCDTQWTVVTDNSPCNGTGGPHAGAYQAGTSFDGDGPQHYFLSQSFLNPNGVSSASLSFWNTYNFSIVFSDTPRTFSVNILDAFNTNLGTVYSTDYHNSSSAGWAQQNVDLTAILAANGGQALTLQFDAYMPESYTGPAAYALDDISLNVEASSAPEPASIVLMVTGLAGVAGVARRRRKTA